MIRRLRVLLTPWLLPCPGPCNVNPVTGKYVWRRRHYFFCHVAQAWRKR